MKKIILLLCANVLFPLLPMQGYMESLRNELKSEHKNFMDVLQSVKKNNEIPTYLDTQANRDLIAQLEKEVFDEAKNKIDQLMGIWSRYARHLVVFQLLSDFKQFSKDEGLSVEAVSKESDQLETYTTRIKNIFAPVVGIAEGKAMSIFDKIIRDAEEDVKTIKENAARMSVKGIEAALQRDYKGKKEKEKEQEIQKVTKYFLDEKAKIEKEYSDSMGRAQLQLSPHKEQRENLAKKQKENADKKNDSNLASQKKEIVGKYAKKPISLSSEQLKRYVFGKKVDDVKNDIFERRKKEFEELHSASEKWKESIKKGFGLSTRDENGADGKYYKVYGFGQQDLFKLGPITSTTPIDLAGSATATQ